MVGKNNLIRQMGNARYLITRSCSTLKDYRLVCKLLGLEKENLFEDKFCWVIWEDDKRNKLLFRTKDWWDG